MHISQSSNNQLNFIPTSHIRMFNQTVSQIPVSIPFAPKILTDRISITSTPTLFPRVPTRSHQPSSTSLHYHNTSLRYFISFHSSQDKQIAATTVPQHNTSSSFPQFHPHAFPQPTLHLSSTQLYSHNSSHSTLHFAFAFPFSG